MIKPYRIFAACLTWTCIIVQYLTRFFDGSGSEFLPSTINFLSYFTVLTNIMVALAFTAPLLAPESKLRRFFDQQAVRAGITLYITVVMVVYWAVLAKIHHPEGVSAVTNIGMHLIIPLLYILDWILFAPKGQMSFKRIPYWILFPFLYGIYTIIRGAFTGAYPYPFMNVAELGMGPVFINMLGFTAFYAIGATSFIAIGRQLGKSNAAANDP